MERGSEGLAGIRPVVRVQEWPRRPGPPRLRPLRATRRLVECSPEQRLYALTTHCPPTRDATGWLWFCGVMALYLIAAWLVTE